MGESGAVALRGQPATETTRRGAATDAPRPGAPRLIHEPALDGLRGVAVLAVLAFHMDRLQGGFLGVDLFFVLSGFLITSLLLSEARQEERIALGAFWARRARRLLPALWLVLVGVAVLLLVYTPDAQRPAFRDDALGTLGYVANWQRLSETASYWDIFSHPSPLDHMWSLAIEEQFYVAWPLVVALLVRRGGRDGRIRRVGWVAGVGAVVSLVWLGVSFRVTDSTWAYYSTPTRLGPTLLGAGLAAATIGRPRRTGPPGRGWDVAAVGAAALMTLALFTIDGIDATYYRGGLAVFAVAACVAIRAVTGGPPGQVARLLSLAPARWMGMISYGVYLWHWPVFVYMHTDRVALDRWAVDVLRLGLTLLAATLSFVLIEQPIRRGALRGRRLYATAAGALAVTIGAVLVATAGEEQATGTTIEGGTVADADLEGIDNEFVAVPWEKDIPDNAVRLLLVGDSGAGAMGPEFVDHTPTVEADPPVAAAFEAQIECSIVWADGPSRNPEGRVFDKEWCGDGREAAWEHLLDEFKPDVVVYYLANAGYGDDHLLDGEWIAECTSTYDAYLEKAFIAEADLLAQDGADIVFLTSPYIASGRPGMAEEVDCRNATIRRAAAARPGTRVLDLNAFITQLLQAKESGLFIDSVHLSDHGARLATEWLIPQISAAAPPATADG